MISNSTGNKKETGTGKTGYSPKTGIFKASVVAINPSIEQISQLIGKQVDWKIDYLGTTKEHEARVSFDIWLQEENSKEFFRLKFMVVKKNRESSSKAGNMQWQNNAGQLTWGYTVEDVKAKPMFADRPIRNSLVGEENLVEFLNAWLLQAKKPNTDTIIDIDMKLIFDGNFYELQSMIPDMKNNTLTCLATISKTAEKSYQNVWKKVLAGWMYSEAIEGSEKGIVGKWISDIKGPFGSKDEYKLEPLNNSGSTDSTYPGLSPIAGGNTYKQQSESQLPF